MTGTTRDTTNPDTTTHADDVAPVPIVDMSGYLDGSDDDRRRIAADLTKACEEIGFVLLSGHGVPDRIIEDFYAVSKRFFELPLEQKRQVRSPVDNLFQGYAHPGPNRGDHTSERQSFNVFRYDTLAEAVALGYDTDMDGIFLEALWPAEPAEFREVWRAYFEEMEALARRILHLVELGLEIPAGTLTAMVERDTSTQAANYYSDDIESGHEPSPFRFKAHMDGSVITILYQDDGPGSLQLHQRGAGWRDVAPVAGTFVMNIGEVMARWTNDRFVATPHRVLKPSPSESSTPRISAPFFLKPAVDAVVGPLDVLVADGDDPHYPTMSGRGWLTKGQADIYAGNDSTKQFEALAAANPALR
ncbi:MAG: 2-oxoglutarate and iron-dependent oxygenase domain-containing protein [Ilumatobacteraceae bacterium]